MQRKTHILRTCMPTLFLQTCVCCFIFGLVGVLYLRAFVRAAQCNKSGYSCEARNALRHYTLWFHERNWTLARRGAGLDPDYESELKVGPYLLGRWLHIPKTNRTGKRSSWGVLGPFASLPYIPGHASPSRAGSPPALALTSVALTRLRSQRNGTSRVAITVTTQRETCVGDGRGGYVGAQVWVFASVFI